MTVGSFVRNDAGDDSLHPGLRAISLSQDAAATAKIGQAQERLELAPLNAQALSLAFR